MKKGINEDPGGVLILQLAAGPKQFSPNHPVPRIQQQPLEPPGKTATHRQINSIKKIVKKKKNHCTIDEMNMFVHCGGHFQPS